MTTIDPAEVRGYLAAGDLKSLFIECLGWDRAHAVGLTYLASHRVHPVAQKSGFLVLQVDSGADGRILSAADRQPIRRAAINTFPESMLVFVDAGRREMLWQPSSTGGAVLQAHRCFTSQIGEGLMHILRRLNFWNLPSDQQPLVRVSERVQLAFRSDRQRFYQNHFADLGHARDQAGIVAEPDRRSEFFEESFVQFQRSYQQYKLLDSADELRLGQKVRLGGPEGKAAQHELVLRNLRLVVAIAKRYRHRGLDLLAIIQHGVIGLMSAAEKFDPDTYGTKFSTYATWWVRQAITRGLGDECRLIRLPIHAHDQWIKWNERRLGMLEELGREPFFDELVNTCREMSEQDITSEKVADIFLAAEPFVPIPHPIFPQSIEDDEESFNPESVYEVSDPNPDDPFEAVAQQYLRHAIASALSNLPPREGYIMRMRFGVDDGRERTLEEVGREFGLTRERIRQIESKALRKLRLPYLADRLRDFLDGGPEPSVVTVLDRPQEDRRVEARTPRTRASEPLVQPEDDFLIGGCAPARPEVDEPGPRQEPLGLPGSFPLFEVVPAPPETAEQQYPGEHPAQLSLLDLQAVATAVPPIDGFQGTIDEFARAGYEVADLRSLGGRVWVYDSQMKLAHRVRDLRALGVRFLYAEHKEVGKWGWWVR